MVPAWTETCRSNCRNFNCFNIPVILYLCASWWNMRKCFDNEIDSIDSMTASVLNISWSHSYMLEWKINGKKQTSRLMTLRKSTKLSLHKADTYPKNTSNRTHEWYSAKLSLMVLEPWRGKEKREEKFECVVISFFIDEHTKGSRVWFCCELKWNPWLSRWTRGVKRSKIITQRGVDVGGFCVAQWAVSISGGLVVWIPSGILMKTLHSLPHRSFLQLCSFAVRVNGKMNIQYKTGYESTSCHPN